jgi:hypothetical protein
MFRIPKKSVIDAYFGKKDPQIFFFAKCIFEIGNYKMGFEWQAYSFSSLFILDVAT